MVHLRPHQRIKVTLDGLHVHRLNKDWWNGLTLDRIQGTSRVQTLRKSAT